jgi:hypothetical protein
LKRLLASTDNKRGFKLINSSIDLTNMFFKLGELENPSEFTEEFLDRETLKKL